MWAALREGELRARAQGIALEENRFVVVRGYDIWEWWCRIGHHPWRKVIGRYDRSMAGTGNHPQRWCNKKGGGGSSTDWSDCRSDGSGEKT